MKGSSDMKRIRWLFEDKDDILASLMLVIFFPVMILLFALIGG